MMQGIEGSDARIWPASGDRDRVAGAVDGARRPQ